MACVASTDPPDELNPADAWAAAAPFIDFAWELDAEHRFRRVTGPGLARAGVRPEQVVGRTAFEGGLYTLLSPSRETFERMRAAREPYHDVRGSLTLPDGSLRYLSVSGTPRFDASGTILGYQGVTRDITAQVVAENALRESEERFRQLVEGAPDILFFATNPARSD